MDSSDLELFDSDTNYLIQYFLLLCSELTIEATEFRGSTLTNPWSIC